MLDTTYNNFLAENNQLIFKIYDTLIGQILLSNKFVVVLSTWLNLFSQYGIVYYLQFITTI